MAAAELLLSGKSFVDRLEIQLHVKYIPMLEYM